jgi:Flp pilus assembly pilin Flp
LAIPGGSRSFRGASAVSLPPFKASLTEDLTKHQLFRRTALDRREAASSGAPVFDFNTNAGGSRREPRASRRPSHPCDERRSAKPSKGFLERGMVAGRTRDEHSNMTRLPVFRFARRETGQTMAEYSVVLAVITPAIVAVLVLYSDAMVNAFQRVVDVIS